MLGGQVPLGVVDVPSAIANVKAELRALAVTSKQRISAAPEVPTFEEAGLRGYEAVGWFGAVAPAGTPKDIINRLNTEIRNALAAPGREGARADRGRRATCHLARGIRRLYPRGNQEVGRSGARRGDQAPMTKSPVIDVHTHMLTNEWVALLEKHGGPSYTLKSVAGGLRAIHLDGAPFMTPVPNMFDWEARIANMDKARVDIAVTSLTCPNVFWGART